MCGDGHFSVTRACTVALDPTFVKGEHWIGSYECTDTTSADRFDIRRLDLVVDAVNGSHVKVHTKFAHQDGQGSFKLSGSFDNSTHRMHLRSNGRDAWIRKPSKGTWYTSDLNGHVTSDHRVYMGSKNDDPSCACRDACDLEVINGTKQYHYRCTTHDTCPNAVHVNGAYRVSCGESTQSCTKFQVNRVCSPHDNNPHNDDPCFCTGQIDTSGRGGSCSKPSSKEADLDIAGREYWCHVDSECIVAGPVDTTSMKPTDGGVAYSGLWWATCNPNATTAAPPTTVTQTTTTTATTTTNTTFTTTTTTTTTTTNTTFTTFTTTPTPDPTTVKVQVVAKKGPVKTGQVAKLLGYMDDAQRDRDTAVQNLNSQCGRARAGAKCKKLIKQVNAAERDLAMATLQYKTYTDIGETWSAALILPTDFDACCSNTQALGSVEGAIAASIASQAQITLPIVSLSRGSVVVGVVVKSAREQTRVNDLANACGLCFELWGASLCAHQLGETPCKAMRAPTDPANADAARQGLGWTTTLEAGAAEPSNTLGQAKVALLVAAILLAFVGPVVFLVVRKWRQGQARDDMLTMHTSFANPLYAPEDGDVVGSGTTTKENPLYDELASDGARVGAHWNDTYQESVGAHANAQGQ